jgi:hypothetical protein
VISAPRSAKSSLTGPAPETPQAHACLNCGAPMYGAFCARCGQRHVPPYPSVRELVVDAFWELSGWDGRFMSTVRALFNHPGLLTREFLEGRRARYISPLRLYLMSSLVYFVLAAAAPNMSLGKKPDPEAGGGAARPATNQAVASAKNGENTNPTFNEDSLTVVRRDAILAQIARLPRIAQPAARLAVADSKGVLKRLGEAMPRMFFALLPVFALILALFYRGHRYPAHLYFAVHLHAFMFLALSIAALANFTRQAVIVEWVGTLTVLWIAGYSTMALRRTYGGSIARTLVKEFGIGVCYLVAGVTAFLITLLLIPVLI